VIPTLPAVSEGWPISEPLLSPHAARALHRTGRRHLGDLVGLTSEDLRAHGAGARGAHAAIQVLQTLAGLPPGRLARLCEPGCPPAAVQAGENAVAARWPALPIEVIAALCAANAVDDEIIALTADLDARKRAMVHARWGLEAPPATLEEVGRAAGITRERARQIIAVKEQQLQSATFRMPLASAAIADLDEVGGALPSPFFETLLRNGVAPASSAAMRLLPHLHRLGGVPEIGYDEDSDLWMTAAGRAAWVDSGRTAELSQRARKVGGLRLRRSGVLPLREADRLSPFGHEHAIRLIGGGRTTFEIHGEYALPQPRRGSTLLRMCRKTLSVTGPLNVEELADALAHSGFRGVDAPLLLLLLEGQADLDVGDGTVAYAPPAGAPDVLSPAERAGVRLLDDAGGAMLWLDFLDGMVAAGFSAPMASVILRRPAVTRIGPALYALRGRTVASETVRRLRRRRAELAGGGVLRSVSVADDEIRAEYLLNRFSMQGVLPAPPQLRGSPREWTVRLSGDQAVGLRVANGFMWPLRHWLARAHLRPGDRIRAVFRPATCEVNFETAVSREAPPRATSREAQILRSLFGDDL
jgi:hypothetical protein